MEHTQKDRKLYLDALRVLAIMGVITIHVASVNNTTREVEWQIANFFSSGCRWSVPIFVMISGSLFLDRNKEIRFIDIYRKYILRIIIAFLFWSTLYAVVNTAEYYSIFSKSGIINILILIINGRYHMWYLFLIVGLYMITPILKVCINNIDDDLFKYWIILGFIIGSCFQFIESSSIYYKIFNDNIQNINVGFLGGYVIYFILGYYLSIKNLNKKQIKLIYYLGIISFLFTVIMTGLLSYINEEPTINIRYNLNPNTFFISMAIYVFFKEKLSNISLKNNYNNLLIKLSKYTFGIYLVHDLILTILKRFNIDANLFNPIISIPGVAILVFIISLLIIHIIDHIKIINKYII